MSATPAPRVFLAGGDHIGWALDAELANTRRALPFARFVSPLNCDVIHSMNWPVLLEFPREILTGRRIICHLPHDPEVAFANPAFPEAARRVTTWIVRSRRALDLMLGRGLTAALVPDILDERVYHRLAPEDGRLSEARRKWNIPEGRYLVGSFQRDTEGADLKSPKLVKGPDLFAEIVHGAHKKTGRIHVVLAGPRRWWIKERLAALGVPFTHAGFPCRGDDLRRNALPRTEINILYNLLDLYLVASRREGGPQAVLEAPATGCKILSSNVGYAAEVLHQKCVFADTAEAVKMVCADIEDNSLADTLAHNSASVSSHTTGLVAPRWEKIYGELMEKPPLTGTQTAGMPGLFLIAWRKLGGRLSRLGKSRPDQRTERK